MDIKTLLNLWIALIGLALSAFFSMSEIAFITVRQLQLEVQAKHKVRGARTALNFVSKPESFLSASLVGTNLANVLATSFGTAFLIYYMPQWATIIVTSVSILILGEIIPKSIGRDTAGFSVPKIAPVLKISQILLFPLIAFVESVASLLFFERKSKNKLEKAFSKDDLKLLFDRVVEQGVIDYHENRFISKLLDFSEITVGECMVPRTHLDAVSAGASREEILKQFAETEHSKLIVYDGTLDNVVGAIFLKDLFTEDIEASPLIREVGFVPESKMADELLKEMQRSKQSIVVVVDEYGGTAGIATIEDIMEEIFGEFDVAFEKEAPSYTKLRENEYMIQGHTELDLLNEELSLQLPEGEYETLAGFLMDRLGHIPEKGEKLKIDNCIYTVHKSTPRSVKQVKLQILR